MNIFEYSNILPFFVLLSCPVLSCPVRLILFNSIDSSTCLWDKGKKTSMFCLSQPNYMESNLVLNLLLVGYYFFVDILWYHRNNFCQSVCLSLYTDKTFTRCGEEAFEIWWIRETWQVDGRSQPFQFLNRVNDYVMRCTCILHNSTYFNNISR